MKWLLRVFRAGMWRYALLIVLLFIIAGLASSETISSITALLVDAQKGSDIPDEITMRIVTVPILALTMGFLFLAGALGIWAIRSTAIIEGRRRVGRFVDAMDYLSDGLLAVDRSGRVTGSNPAARGIAGPGAGAGSGRTLRDYFPYLSEEDLAVLEDASAPQEVECVSREPDRLRAFRFRSQPSEDMNLILVSDVTRQKADEMRGRQVARLQLIGRIARGVAHDFNNILCAISGHASLLSRQRTEGDSVSLKAIIKESQRGAALAGQMLDLSRTGVKGSPCASFAEHVEKAASLLRVALSADWHVIADVQGNFAAVPLTDIQVEQVIVNLGLIASDELDKPGVLHIRVREPSIEPLMNLGKEAAAVALISAYGTQPDLSDIMVHPEAQTTAEEAGVIQSVVRSVIEEVGGRIDVIVTPGNHHSFRFSLPPFSASERRMSAMASIPEELRMYLAGWKVLLAVSGREGFKNIEEHLKETGMAVTVTEDIVSALQHVEADRELSAIVCDRRVLGEEADALLRAIIKLRPRAGLVVLCSAPESMLASLKSDIVFEPLSVTPETILQSLLHSREMAGARKHA
jgi:two-component system, cell cycle sensor histidine kinase and response regulator CckA